MEEEFRIEAGEKYVILVQKPDGVAIKGFTGDLIELCHWLHKISYMIENNQNISYGGKRTPNG